MMISLFLFLNLPVFSSLFPDAIASSAESPTDVINMHCSPPGQWNLCSPGAPEAAAGHTEAALEH